jgi:hypothetical protein
MKIFFLMRNSVHLRNYQSLVRALATGGHQILLGFIKVDQICPEAVIADLAKECPRINYIIFPKRIWLWRKPADFIRTLQTYIRFLDRRYKDSHKLRERADSLLPGFVRNLVKMIVGNNDTKRWSFIYFLRRIENAIPLDSFIVKFLKDLQPDVFLITPLIDLHAKQLDWLKCAKSRCIKSGLCVSSWDNLSNKSLIQTEPDAVFVWNEIQQREAVELHQIPASKVVITGAQCYDRLFAHQPSTLKEEFFAKVGFTEQGDYLLYLCSSKFIAPHEIDFIREWIMRLKKSNDPVLNRIGVLVRPHPQNATQWRDVDLSGYDNVAVYPRDGANPIRGNTFDDFFDSIYHSVAAVGINTSSMIESGILNKPAFTILSPKFHHAQNGTLHFQHLVKGGFLNVSGSLDEHVEQLGRVLADPKAYQVRISVFIQNFVRPHGIAVECTPLFVKAIEDLERKATTTSIEKFGTDLIVRILLFPWAGLSYAYKKSSKILSGYQTSSQSNFLFRRNSKNIPGKSANT